MWIPALLAAAALGHPAPSTPTAPSSTPPPSQGSVVHTIYPTCSWRTSDGGSVVVTCSSWNSCVMTRYDSSGNIVRQINITPDWC